MRKNSYCLIIPVLVCIAVTINVLPLTACSENNVNTVDKSTYTVTFDTDGGNPVNIAPIQVGKGESMGSQFPSPPSKGGYTFGGWYEGSKPYTKGTLIEKNVNLRAKWNEIPPELNIGTANNPLLKGGDVPDPAIIRVGNAYYMVSTTMYFCPVAPVMKSYDMVNWKIVSYCADIIDDAPNFRLEEWDSNETTRLGDYGRGQWASSIRYYNNKFWVLFTNNSTNKSYLYSTPNADTGPWTRTVINKRFHDPSIFQDNDGKMYVFHGYTTLYVTEMTSDLSATVGEDVTILTQADAPGGGTGSEGSQVYKNETNGYYYVFFCTWGLGPKTQHVLRSANIKGPYEQKTLLNGKSLYGKYVAQGGIVDTPDGDWYAFLFKEPNASGRVPVLVPLRWGNDGWPTLGDSGGNIPTTLQIKIAQGYEQNLYASDEFDNTKLQLAWQWNHNPDNANWSLTEKPGYLRLRTGRTSKTIYHARNTLTQRVFEPACNGITALETTSMKDGDRAGLMILQSLSGFICIEQDGAQKYIAMYTGDNDTAAYRLANAIETRQARTEFNGDRIYLRVNCTFRGNNTSGAEQAVFQYSTNGTTWTTLGTTFNMQWTTQHFTGARFGLFNYATKEAGGYVDFDYFHVN
ncbi:beta-xylosidase family glycoside hydrolase [Treponema sp. R80B11-R83G3]